MGNIKLLDCTLRDGGHVNQGRFGRSVIKSIISNLVKSKVDIIEVGFLWNYMTEDDVAKFHSINEVKALLPKNMGNTKLALMADGVDLSHLEPCDGTVEIIRLSFRKTEFEWAERMAGLLKEKGYKIYINPIHGSSFSDEEYLNIIKRVNQMKPDGFSIVDTFGAMRQNDLGRIYYLVEHNLDKSIELGIHLHENLGLSYSLVQYILKIVSPTRSIIIDGSLYGMGKIPGNLCIEQVMDYLNNEYSMGYAIEPVYDAIDDYIMPIYEKVGWGYSVPYAISAQCGVHRTYAEYLVNKDRLHTKDIRRLLNSIGDEYAEIFNKDYIESLYKQYMLVKYDDSVAITQLEKKLKSFEKIIVIAPGSSLNNYTFKRSFLTGACIITVNFMYDKVPGNFFFFGNSKRLGYAADIDSSNMIITSNLIDEVNNPGYIVSRNELSYHDDLYCDDSTLMCLNLLKRCGIREVFIAGFDGFYGFTKQENNFYDHNLDRPDRDGDYDLEIRLHVLREAYKNLKINFLTPSLYEMEENSY